MTNTIQKKFKVSSTQLLYQSCPYQAITLFITGPFVDGLLTKQNVFAFNYTPQVLVRTGTLSCSWLQIIISKITVVFFLMTGIYCPILLNISFRELQHLPCNWKDITSYLSGPRAFENMPCFSLWLCSSTRPLQLAQHFRYLDCYSGDGTLLVLLQSGEPAKGQC